MVATGDGTDADFQAIYDNLFRDQTFNPDNGSWSYSPQPSYGLPEFSGWSLCLLLSPLLQLPLPHR